MNEIAVKPEEDFSIKVNGFEIKSNQIYQVVPKPDEDAPDGFRNERTTKVLSPRVTDSITCVKNGETQTWDTGFYVYSPCYKNLPMDQREVIVEKVKRNIKDPIENLYGGGDRLNQNNDDFWDDWAKEVRNGDIFNTANPKELLALYMGVLHRSLAPKKDASHTAYREAKYCIINKEEVIEREASKTLNYNKAIGNFYTLLENDKPKLVNILGYLGLQADIKTNEVTLNNIVTNYLKDKNSGDQNVEIFLNAFDMAKTKSGKIELKLFQDLKDLAKKGIVTKEGSDYMLAGEPLGSSFKVAAKTVAKSKKLQEAVITALD